MEVSLRATVMNPLSADDLAVYREPYPTRESRRPLLAWPRSFPIGGQPADVATRMQGYDDWLANSAGVPKLLLTFDGSADTLMIGPQMVAWCMANVANLEVRGCGPARHMAPEDQPTAIANAIDAWADRHLLR